MNQQKHVFHKKNQSIIRKVRGAGPQTNDPLRAPNEESFNPIPVGSKSVQFLQIGFPGYNLVSNLTASDTNHENPVT